MPLLYLKYTLKELTTKTNKIMHLIYFSFEVFVSFGIAQGIGEKIGKLDNNTV